MKLVTEENITDIAVERWSTAHDARMTQVMTSLVRHLHAFVRDVQLGEGEWMAAMQWLKAVGRVDSREEFILASDVVGLSQLVIEVNNRRDAGATPSTLIGPFHIDGAPARGFGEDMSEGITGRPLYLHGTVRDLDGTAIPGAVLDAWQADADGIYDFHVEVDEARLRGRYTTRDDGDYCIRTIAPEGYTIPLEGPVADLLGRTDMSHWRPAHVHFLIDVAGYELLVTHLFQEGARYIDDDAVFAAKSELVVPFDARDPGPTPDGGHSAEPWVEARYDFVLQPKA